MHFREKSAVKKISMEGLSYDKQQDTSTRNELGDDITPVKEGFSKTIIKEKAESFKTPSRDGVIHQTPKLDGIGKLVS